MIYLAKNLIHLRKAKKLTQTEIAEIVKVKKTTYSNYENKYSRPDFETLELLSKFYGLSVDLILYFDLDNGGSRINPTHENKLGELQEVNPLQGMIADFDAKIEGLWKEINKLRKEIRSKGK